MATPKTLIEAVRMYADLDLCERELAKARWPEGVTCPTCGRTDVSYLANQRRWQCKSAHAKRQFSAKVGTIFEDSPIPLDKWFVAIWLIASAKNGISSYELQKAIGVKTQKTAWYMLHRIRLAMQTQTFAKLSGGTEIDESYIGGKARHVEKFNRTQKKQGRTAGKSKARKAVVMGLLERNTDKGYSQIRTIHVESIKKHHLLPQVYDHVEPGTEVYTDALASYRQLGDDYVHGVVDHAEKYVDGIVHTNGLENFWSLLKRGIKGTYVSVEPFHLFRYLDEQAYRFNTRKDSDGSRFAEMLTRLSGRRLTYANLTGHAVANA